MNSYIYITYFKVLTQFQKLSTYLHIYLKLLDLVIQWNLSLTKQRSSYLRVLYLLQ